MATIRLRQTADGEKRYHVQIRLKGYPTQTASFRYKKDADKWVATTEAAIHEGRHVVTSEAKKRTFAELAERYIAEELPKKKAKARLLQMTQMQYWLSHMGQYSLDRITPALIAKGRDKLLNTESRFHKKYSGSTVSRYLAALSHCYTVAVQDWQWCSVNPVLQVRKPKNNKPRTRYLSDEEESTLLAVCKESPNPYLYPVVLLALSTGARLNEILSLTWKQVDLKRGTVHLNETKNELPRTLALIPEAISLLGEQEKVPHISGLIFPGDTGKPAYIRKPWLRAVTDAGLDTDDPNQKVVFHTLRHTAASKWIMSGLTLAEVGGLLGHKSPMMTARYAHLAQGYLREKALEANKQRFA